MDSIAITMNSLMLDYGGVWGVGLFVSIFLFRTRFKWLGITWVFGGLIFVFVTMYFDINYSETAFNERAVIGEATVIKEVHTFRGGDDQPNRTILHFEYYDEVRNKKVVAEMRSCENTYGTPREAGTSNIVEMTNCYEREMKPFLGAPKEVGIIYFEKCRAEKFMCGGRLIAEGKVGGSFIKAGLKVPIV